MRFKFKVLRRMNTDQRQTLLIRKWLENTISTEELNELRSDPDFDSYQKIIHASEHFLVESFNKDEIFDKVIASRVKKTSSFSQSRMWYSIAAAVLLLIGVTYTFTNNDSMNELHVAYGESKMISLPSGSEVTVNASALLTYDSRNWENQRDLTLDGEAFFDVTKGQQFTVHTALGDITVLGTEFNVSVFEDFLEVKCYEGSVAVTSKGVEKIITMGEGVRVMNSQMQSLDFEESVPSWISGVSKFSEVPAKYVLHKLQNQYGLQLEGKWETSNTFTGAFPNDDITTALEIVMGSLQFEYKFDGNKTVIRVP